MQLKLARLSPLVAALLLALPATGAAAAALPACPAADLTGFGAGTDAAAAFTRMQMQRGEVTLSTDPLNAANRVAYMSAGRKQGAQVGKADLILAYTPLGAGRVIEMGGRFFFPHGTPLDSLILMDLECASCGIDTNPGIRLYLRDGRLRVDRSKIGIEDAFLPVNPLRMRTGVWHDIRWEVTLGADRAGRSRVFVDGNPVMDARGTTLLTQKIISQIAPVRVREQVDRFQVGLTANSNSRAQSLYLDDVSICVR